MTGGSLALVTSGILAIVAATAILAKNVNDKQMKELEEAFVNVAAAAGVAGSSIRKIETAGLQIYSPFVKTEKIVKELAEELGLTETQVLSIALASEEVQKGHAKTLETMNLMLEAQVEQTRSYRAYAEYAAARAASAEAEIKRLAAVQEAADKKVAAAKEALEKSYVDARKNVLDILASEQSEYDKILAQIKVLQATPWAKGKLEDDRLAAIEVLKKNILDLQKTEMEGAVANIKAYANESRESRKTVEATLAEYQNYYAEIAASQLKKLKDLQTERDKAIKLAESTGANKQSILDDYAAQEKKLKDEMAAAEKARIAAIKSASDAYYAQLLAQNQAKLVAIQTESRLAIEAATKQGLSTVALKAGYAAQEEAINQAMQAAEKARVAEMTTIDAAYYSYLANLTGDRLLQLENEKNQAIADAQAAGMAIDTIITAYAAKEVALKETMAAEEKAREQAKLDAKLQFEQTYIDKIRVDSSTKLELIQFEKEAAIKAAEEAGADISAIEEYYALKEAEQIAADAKEATDKKIAETQRYAGYTTSALSAIGDLVDTLSANELAAIDAQTAATIAGYDAEIVALQATYDAEQLIRDQKAIDDQKVLDKEKADLDELETMRESMRGNVLQGLYDEQEELLRKEELGVVLTDAEKARIADIQNMIAGGGQAELDALKAKQAAGATLSQVELTRVSELEAAINGAKNSQLTGIDALIAAKKNAANLALSEVEANKAAQKAADAALKESNKTLENQKIKANYDAEVSKHKIAVDSFNANKALASASAAVALGLAIMQGYAQLGPIAGSVAALVLAGIGIAQQAAIWLPAPPPAPPAPVYLASGGYIPKTFGGVSTVLGEGNSAEVVLPLTDKVFRKLGDSIVNNLLGSTKQTQQSTPINQVIQVIMDGKVLYNVVNTGLTNRSIRVPSAALV
jgi:tubulin-specific chaperone A